MIKPIGRESVRGAAEVLRKTTRPNVNNQSHNTVQELQEYT